MKFKLFSFILILSFVSINQVIAQNKPAKTWQTETFEVWGNCEMCKETIESSLDIKGVKSAKWNQKTKMITVVFNPEKITLDQIHAQIAAVGYDTEKVRGSDKAYAALPECCHYQRKP